MPILREVGLELFWSEVEDARNAQQKFFFKTDSLLFYYQRCYTGCHIQCMFSLVSSCLRKGNQDWS